MPKSKNSQNSRRAWKHGELVEAPPRDISPEAAARSDDHHRHHHRHNRMAHARPQITDVDAIDAAERKEQEEKEKTRKSDQKSPIEEENGASTYKPATLLRTGGKRRLTEARSRRTSFAVEAARSSVASEKKIPSIKSMKSMNIERTVSVSNLNGRAADDPINLYVLLRVFLYHVCFPFVIPFAILIDGIYVAKNMSLILNFEPDGSSSRWIFGQQLVDNLAIIAIIVLHATNEDPLPITTFVISPLVMMATHRLMIATKYAILDQDTWDLFCSNYVSRDIIAQTELVSWLSLTTDDIDRNIRRVAKKSDIDLDNSFVYLDPEIYEAILHDPLCPDYITITDYYSDTLEFSRDQFEWQRSLRKGLLDSEAEEKACENAKRKYGEEMLRQGCSALKAGMIKVPILPIIARCLHHAERSSRPYFKFYKILAAGCVQAFVPLIVFFTTGSSSSKYNHASIAQIVLSTYLIGKFFAVFNIFMSVGLVDYARRREFTRVVGAMIDVTADLKGGFQSSIGNIFVDFSWPSNIISWHLLRETLLGTGAQFRLRLSIYVSYVTVILLALSASVLVGTYYGTMNIVDQSFCVIFVAIVGFKLGGMVYFGASANEQTELQQRAICKLQYELRSLSHSTSQKSNSGSKKDEIRLKHSDHLMDSIIKLLEFDAEQNPIRILGFKASFEMFTSIGAVALGSVASALADRFFN